MAALNQTATNAGRNNLLAYAIGMQPGYQTPPHIELIASKLEAMARGDIKRLIIQTAPRHGKSNLVSELFPAWYLGRNPTKQVMATTYGQELSDGFGRKVRNQIMDERFQLMFPECVLSPDSKAAARFNTTKGGVYHAMGVGGAATGRGADCLAEGTLVHTDKGLLPIEQLDPAVFSGRVLSFNHERSQLEYKPVVAIKKRKATWLYRITTVSGRVLSATADHRIFANGRYVAASSISPGDTLVRVLPCGVHTAGLRGDEGTSQGTQGLLLRTAVFDNAPRHQEQPPVQGLWAADNTGRVDARGEVLQSMQAEGEGSGDDLPQAADELPNLQHGVLGSVAWRRPRQIPGVLRQTLRGDRTFAVDGYSDGEPEVEARGEPVAETAALSPGLPGDATACVGTGRASVCGLRDRAAGPAGGASPGQLADEQRRVEPGYALRPLPQQVARGEGWETQRDTVALVERVCQDARVYDIQVAETENFFAHGINVHNCLIVDDALKNREEADSKLMRDKLWDWFASVAYTRLMPGGAVATIQTRWHEDDLVGRLMNGKDKYELVNLPAVAEENDALNRAPGTALWPERYDEKALEQIRFTIGEREFAALYQQRPAPLEGAMFKRQWLTKGAVPRAGARIAMGVDLALSLKQSADYTAIVIIARDELGKLYVLDAVRERCDFPTALQLIKDMAAKWKPAQIGIETVAFQAVVVQELLRTTTLPIRGITPDRDKVTRAQPLALRYEQGMVSHAIGLQSWFESELLSFPQSEHDDGVDALVYAYQTVMRLGYGDEQTAQPAQLPAFEVFDTELGM